ncbi:fibronectin type III domain-containing protein [Lutibacter sp.]
MKTYFLKTIAIVAVLFFSSSCDDDDDIQSDILAIIDTTVENLEATYTTINISGTVLSDEYIEVTSKGVCWSTSPNPTIEDTITTEIDDVFTSTISNLTANTTYYFRVYAVNDVGVTYSEELSFNTLSLEDSIWDFEIFVDDITSWNASVTFNADGTTVFDDATNVVYGSWLLEGNVLTFNIDTSGLVYTYSVEGTLFEQTINGVWEDGIMNWIATPQIVEN